MDIRGLALKLRRLRLRHPLQVLAHGRRIVGNLRLPLPARIQTRADPASLDRLLQVVHRAWARHAESAPYLSVLTRPMSRNGEPLYQGEPTRQIIERFYATGAAEADAVSATLRRFGVNPAQLPTILEFGCGLGRVSRWLCQDFDRVIGVDIAQRYLDIAVRELAAHEITNFVPLRITSLEQVARLPIYDIVYSRYVLQHNPPPVIKIILTQLLRQLSPNGFAIVQVPTFGRTYSYSVAAHLAGVPEMNTMEMHVFPQRAIRALAHEEGCVILQMQETDDVGESDWKSHTFIMRKKAREHLDQGAAH